MVEKNYLAGSAENQNVVPGTTAEIVNNTLKKPIFTLDVGSNTVRNIQLWITKSACVEIFQDSPFRRGFSLFNNSTWTIYVGTVDDVATLQQVGYPVLPKGSFSSAFSQCRLYAVADALAAGTVDLRIWEEQL